jgi:esterase/lipase superfamily enzyme
MDIAVYGHYGLPLLMFPTAAADYLEYERFEVIEALTEFIDAGKIKVFSINSINREGWLNPHEHPKHKAEWQVQYNLYVAEEVVPYIWHHCRGQLGILAAGASLGAFHAANQLFRRPDLFDGMLAMSGGYDIRPFLNSDYYDDNIYYNNPVDYLPGLEGSNLAHLRQKQQIHILTGQGAHEDPQASRRLSDLLHAKGIPHNLDIWGHEVPHDWPSWRAMLRHYIGERL